MIFPLSRLRIRGVALAVVVAMVFSASIHAQDARDGEIQSGESGTLVWSEEAASWVSPQVFWLSFAKQNGGKFWGQSFEYPAYNKVSEHDTLLIENASGVCLMYFFHERWRRAQDVRRWDPQFNELSGCPYVFD
ncbi:MAG: hypothetical protein AAGI44_16740 [Pseudomonadota bacterium]